MASKIFFHLEEHDQALRLGLGAGAYFDVVSATSNKVFVYRLSEESFFLTGAVCFSTCQSAKTEFVETLVAKAIDQYIHLREDKPQGEDAPPMDPRLEAIVEKMFNR